MPLAVARLVVSGSQAGHIQVEPGQQAVRVETKGRIRAFEVAAEQGVYRLVLQVRFAQRVCRLVARWALG